MLQQRFPDSAHSMTTEDVCNTLIKPATLDRRCSYAELLLRDEANPQRYLGPATVFVSHAWKYKFLDLVATMEDYEMDEDPGAMFWIDFIPNNQHTATSQAYEW
jgi:hypothetical protein